MVLMLIVLGTLSSGFDEWMKREHPLGQRALNYGGWILFLVLLARAAWKEKKEAGQSEPPHLQ